MNEVSTCPNCGALLSAASADGLCPSCLLRLALAAEPNEPAAVPGHPALPRAFGPYVLTEEIGRGGMGVVYAARQPQLGRTVAVKLLLSGVHASEAALRRFQLEAAAAAGLQHPNIVAIHDYGEVEGQPYYAMDLVAGRNLAELCAGRPLLARQAAEFLRLLAGAVHYAHRRGVLHRDLKPSNVLVDDENRPRIADFGLAKLLGSADGATLTGQMLGSPSYAAPEQATGRDAEITVASDVYGLGALFYHLLTGRAPFNAATPTDTLRLLLDTEPPPPRLLNPALPRDLETICLKCLSKDPAQRYATAAAVAEDVERFVSGRPIRAQAPGLFYRMRKFASRHRTAVGAGAAVLLALVIGLVLALFGFRRAVVQRRATDAARGQAAQLIALMSHQLEPVLEERGGMPQLIQMTEATVHYYETLPPELRNTKTDQGQADAMAALARLRGRSPNNRRGAETALRTALALREKIARENPNDPEAAAAWLSDESEMPEIIGDPTAGISEKRWEEMVRRGRELHRRFPDNLRVTQCLSDILWGYVHVAYEQFGKPREAMAVAAECQELIEKLLASQPKDKAPPSWIGKSLITLANAMISHDEVSPGRAAGLYEQALTYCTEALKTDPGNLKLREQTAEAARDLSYFAITPERSRDSERIARDHYRVLIAMSPDDQMYRLNYALTHMMEAWYLFNYGPDFEAAPKAFREFHALLEPLPLFIGRGGYYASWPWTWICNHMSLAVFAAWAGKPTETRQEIERAQLRFADYLNRFPEGSFERLYTRVKFLSLKEYALYWLRDWTAMAGASRDCRAEIEAGLRQKPDNISLLLRKADTDAFLAVAAQHDGRSAEAIAQLRPAIETMRAAPFAYSELELHSILGIAQKALTESFVQHGDIEDAKQAAEQLLLVINPSNFQTLPEQDWDAGALTLAAGLCDSVEATRCIGLTDRAKAILTSTAAIGRLTFAGKENLAIIARLRAEAAERLAPDALERTGRYLDAAAATDPEASERFTRAGEATWNFLPNTSAISSLDARQSELAAREGYRALMARYPGNEAYRFLFAETHRMECYVHFGWDGQVEPARAAFRQYDALLQPFEGRKGYDSVRRTRLFNSLHLAQLSASVGDKADANRWLKEAQERFDAYVDRVPAGSRDRSLASIRFLEESAWSAWWLKDWPELARLAQKAQSECESALKEQQANDELVRRRAIAEDFAALAMAGAGQNSEAETRLQAAREGMRTPKETRPVYGVWDGDAVVCATENALIEELRKNGDLARARKWADDLLWANELWAPRFSEYWRAQKQLAIVSIRAASFLDPTVPFEAARCKELLDQAAAILSPERVAGRLTVDVQETLKDIERLRATKAPPSQ